MKKNFTLFSFLLVILNFALAQNTGEKKHNNKPKSKSSYSSSKKTSGPNNNKNNSGTTSSGKSNANTNSYDVPSENSSALDQNITGIWKGYFVQNTLGLYEDRYRFEVQVAQQSNDGLNAVTYSYKTTVFYGKAEAKGINTVKTNNIILNELKLVDLRIAEKSEPCLMTCYLEYSKMGGLETLTGSYSSRNVKDKTDCGSGKVYLEKVATSDFYKEEFVTRREEELNKKRKIPAKKPTVTNRPLAATGNANKPPTTKSTVAKKPAIKPGAEGNLIPKAEKKDIDVSPETAVVPKEEAPRTLPTPPAIKEVPRPDILKNRNNEIVKTITTSAREFKIELYDNGQIDGDRISVYHNNQLIVSNKTLTDKAIAFSIKADETVPVHEFVMVAENLGSIPPNTALMILTAGTQRYELFLTSTEQKNAVVKVVFQP